MSKIIAESDDMILTVLEDAGEIRVYVNGEESEDWQDMMDEIAAKSPPMGGTFYPEPGTMLAYYHVLKNGYFAEWVEKLTVEGDIGEMPCEDGVIY